MADLASIGAATAAGYREQVVDHGPSFRDPSNRFEVELTRQLVGAPGQSGFTMRALGSADTQVNAEAVALQALNSQRRARYAGSSSVPQDADSFTNQGSGVVRSSGTALIVDIS
jgi:hypothetical protein